MTVQATAHSRCTMICSNFWTDTFKQ